jgi:hypothetical protein
VGGVNVPIYHTASGPEYMDENTFFYPITSQTATSDIAAFYSERLAAMGWPAQPGEQYEKTAHQWATQSEHAYQRMIYTQLSVFAGTFRHQQRYLLVAVGMYPSPTLCGDNPMVVIVRVTSTPTASARSAEGFALFDQLEVDSMGRIVSATKGSCSG